MVIIGLNSMAQVFVVMGVSGCGKSTVGQALADELHCPFYDADDYHPIENIVKMAKGIPLDDADRKPWLARLASLLEEHLTRDESAVLACSALKKGYRDLLRLSDDVKFIYLKGDYDLILQRMQARDKHYMKADMLQSQYDTLEEPAEDEAMTISIDQSVDDILANIQQHIH